MPTSPCCCAGWSMYPIATAVRLPSTDPAPIGRVLDAGADAVIIAMVESAEQAAAAVAATRYAPAGVRSFGPLLASLGLDPAALEARVSVFAMVETAQGLSALEEICAVPGLTGVYVGPADLAISLGYGLADAWTHADGPRRDERACKSPRRRRAWWQESTQAQANSERRWPNWVSR